MTADILRGTATGRPRTTRSERIEGVIAAMHECGIQALRCAVRQHVREGSAVPPVLMQLAQHERAQFVD